MLTGVIDLVSRAGLILADDPVPEDNDVVAGPWGAIVFVVLILATVFLMFSFVKQLRKAQAAKDAGVYGDEPVDEDALADDQRPEDDRG
ncbi:MAG: hypothetical protein U0R78_00230 [Nocardioidaceae bacterium]